MVETRHLPLGVCERRSATTGDRNRSLSPEYGDIVICVSNQTPTGRGLISLEQTAEIHSPWVLEARGALPHSRLILSTAPRGPLVPQARAAQTAEGLRHPRDRPASVVPDRECSDRPGRRLPFGSKIAALVAGGRGDRGAQRLKALEYPILTLAADLAATSDWNTEKE